MASRRRRKSSLGKVVTSVESRIARMEKRPGAKALKRNVVTTEKLGYRAVVTKNIVTDAVTPNEAAFGVNIVSPTEPDAAFLKAGTTWTIPDTGATAVYDADNSTFIPVTDATAMATADGKNTIYVQTSAPTGGTYKTNDLWFDSDDGNKLYAWSGTAWVSAQDTAIAAAQAAAVAAQSTADGKNAIYRQTSEPTGGTYKAGDTWFDTDGDNAIYRYSLGSTGTVSKKALTTNIATLTFSAAHSFTPGESITVSGVDATFNGTYTVLNVPTATTLRYNKTAADVTEIVSTGTVTSTAGWKALLLGSNAITSISANQISTGTLAAGVVYAGSINTNQISAGTLAAGVVYAGSIAATQIAAGTLSAGVIYAGTISASNITAGSITAAISMSSATITGGTVQTASSGQRVVITSTDSNRIKFYGSGTTEGAVSVSDYRIFMYSPSSTYGAGAYISLYGDQDPTTPNNASIIGGPAQAYGMYINSSGVKLDQGTFAVRVSANGVIVDGAAGESVSAVRNVRITTSAPVSGSDSSTYANGSILLVREA